MPRTIRRSLAALALLLVCVGLIALARRAADAPATSDTAVIESYTLMATQGRLLVGAYSRFQWHHPGPLYFYVLAPFYLASGNRTVGLHAAAAAISIGAIWLAASVLLRRRPSLAATAAAAISIYAWRASEAAASPWNPHVPLLPSLALIVVTADVVAGRPQLLPAVAILASLAGQAHIALMPLAVTMGSVAVLRAVVGALSGADAANWRRSLIWTMVALTLAWSLPLYEQVTGTPRGNVTELWQFFAHQAHRGQSWPVAISAWSDMLAAIARPDFYVAHGWPFVESPVRWAEALTVMLLGAVAVHGVIGARARDRFVTALAALLLGGSGVALWSATRIDEQIFDHDVFWIVALGILAIALAADLVLTIWRRTAIFGRTAAFIVTGVLLVVATATIAAQVRAVALQSFEPSADAKVARALADDLEAFMNREGVKRPVVKIDQDAWGYVAGAVLELQKRGRVVSVDEDWVVMFTPEFRITGREDAVITIAMPPEHLRLVDAGEPLISAHEPVYAHVRPVSTP